jgi:hypothetical protein
MPEEASMPSQFFVIALIAVLFAIAVPIVMMLADRGERTA